MNKHYRLDTDMINLVESALSGKDSSDSDDDDTLVQDMEERAPPATLRRLKAI